METLLPQFPHIRTAPEHVLRGLRAVDPTTDLVYLGWGRWQLVSVRPLRARKMLDEKRAPLDQANGILANAMRLLDTWYTNPEKIRANPGAYRRLRMRYDFAVLASLGGRPIGEPYAVAGEPTSEIVDDFRRMDWLWRTTSDDQLWQMIDAPKLEQQRLAHDDITDPARGRDAWRYAFTQSHWVGARPGHEPRPRSGFRRNAIPSQ